MEPVLLAAVVALAIALGLALLRLRRLEGAAVATATPPNRAAAGDAVPSAPPSSAGPATPAPVPSAGSPVVPEDLLPVGVLHVDADRRVAAANERAGVLLGGRASLVGRSVMEVFLDARLEASLDGIARGATATLEHRTGAGPEGRTLLLRARRTSAGLVIVLEDVTELRRLQQIRTEFIDNLGHELRTPLSTVMLLAETLAREAEATEVPPKMRERIARIEIETGHIAQMVAEMLDLARIEGGSLLRLEDDVDLARLADASAERLRLFAERSGVTLEVDAAPDLPRLRGDESRLGQVVVNLVHNAVKFSPDGGEVRVAVRRSGEAVEIAVTDHGIGIKPADRARIFERFYKADRARVRGGGTGLGLSIARHVVEGHGGRITVASEDGAGSTFTVILPVAPPSPAATDEPEEPA